MQITNPEILFVKEKLIPAVENIEIVSTQNKFYKVIVIYENAAKELPTGLQVMLDKLIQACKFKPEDTLYLSYNPTILSFNSLKKHFQPEIVLLFGNIHLTKNMNPLIKYRAYEINGIKILRAEKLEKLEQMKSEKSELWTALKLMLHLS